MPSHNHKIVLKEEAIDKIVSVGKQSDLILDKNIENPKLPRSDLT